jgi:hypothetical protein
MDTEEKSRKRAEKKRLVDVHRSKVLKVVNPQAQAVVKGSRREEEISVPVRFTNDLPDVPVEAKFVTYPFDEDFLTAFDILNGVSSETARPRTFHPDLDLGVGVSLLDPEAYSLAADGAVPPVHPTDAYITSEDFARPAAKKVDIVDPAKVEWVLLSQHLHNDLYDAVYKHSDSGRVQTLDFARRKAALAAEMGPGDKVTRIEASFAACSGDAPLVHTTKPTLQPRRVWELLPDPERVSTKFVSVAFDVDPDDTMDRRSRGAPALPPATKRARLARGLLRTPAAQPVNANENSTVVHFLLPEAEDVEPAVQGAGRAAAPMHARAVRDYAMVVDRADPRTGEELLVWAWDDQNARVMYTDVRARAFLTRLRDADEAARVVRVAVHSREGTEEEAEEAEAARVRLDETNPAAKIAAWEARRRERAEAEAELKKKSAAERRGPEAPAGRSAATATQSQSDDDF